MMCTEFPRAPRHPAGFDEIEPDQLVDPSVRIVDVREHHELAVLPAMASAEIVPLGELASRAGRWKLTDPIVLVCRSGARSGRAAALLADMGFRCAVSLRGGMLAVWARDLAR